MTCDASSWNESVERLGGRLLQSWNWGEFKSLHGWSVVRIAAPIQGPPRAVAQLLFRAVGPFSVGYIPRGPLVGELSAAEVAEFARGIDEACRSQRAIAILVEPETEKSPLRLGDSPLWQMTSVTVQPRRTIKVSLAGTDDDLLSRMKPKTRYNVRLAERRGVTIRRGGLRDIHLFFGLLRETADRDQFGVHEIAYFDDMLRVFGDDAALFLAEFEGEAAAGLLALRAAGEAIYMYGATRTKHQRHMPAYLLQFAAMRWARDSGCTTYDLWGIPDTDEPPADKDESGSINVREGMWGVYRFKQGFGGDVVQYPGVYERVYIKPLMRAWRMMRPNLV